MSQYPTLDEELTSKSAHLQRLELNRLFLYGGLDRMGFNEFSDRVCSIQDASHIDGIREGFKAAKKHKTVEDYLCEKGLADE